MKKGWFRRLLAYVGIATESAAILAESAKDIGVAVGAGKKTQADLDKASAAAKAARGLGKAADHAANRLDEVEPPPPKP